MEDRRLFRGRRIDNGEWIDGYLLKLTKVRYAITNEYPLNPYGGAFADKSFRSGKMSVMIYEVDPNTIGQCTELKDKNGKLIFEGDIVKLRNRCQNVNEPVGVVFWYKVMWVIGYPGDNDIDRFIVSVSFNSDGDEIIGNIHDNPELLEVET